MELTDKQLHDLRQMVETQGSKGNWDYDPYMQGMFNGMELMLATIEDREPVFKTAPDEWLHDKPTSENQAFSKLAQGSKSNNKDTDNE